ncbi:MAG: hypothetical protein ACI8R4_003481 [Paracoccaceae bacterium]|jgi:hypothetical protein
MQIDFLEGDCPGRSAAQDHIRKIYWDKYRARVSSFAPVLVTAKRADGTIVCAAGLRTAASGFFSEPYLNESFEQNLLKTAGAIVPRDEIMEVVSLASATPFPVLPVMDAMINWGRAQGKTCGVFTATSALRRLLGRTGLQFDTLSAAIPNRVTDPENWGSYYETDPWVCAFRENAALPVALCPRRQTHPWQSEAS